MKKNKKVNKNKKVVQHPKIKAYQNKMKKNSNCCHQCLFPWHDGICEDGNFHSDKEEYEKINALAFKLYKKGWQF